MKAHEPKQHRPPGGESRATRREAGAASRVLTDSPRQAAQRERIDSAFGSLQQHQGADEEELQMKALQRQRDEELPLQGRFALQRSEGLEEEEPLQAAGREQNRTGLSDALKNGVESLSGVDLSDVRVHRDSPLPAQVDALATAQGHDIHLGPGQEQHLPHEAWHVVQQAQGRVPPTLQLEGVAVNDDAALEREADEMGAKALQAVPR